MSVWREYMNGTGTASKGRIKMVPKLSLLHFLFTKSEMTLPGSVVLAWCKEMPLEASPERCLLLPGQGAVLQGLGVAEFGL